MSTDSLKAERDTVKRLLRRYQLVGTHEARMISHIPLSSFHRYYRNRAIVAQERKQGIGRKEPLICLPEPIAILRCGPIWLKQDIENFAFYLHHLSAWGRPHKGGYAPKPCGPESPGRS